MPHRTGVGGNCAPEKLRAAKNQQAHLYIQRKRLIEQSISSDKE